MLTKDKEYYQSIDKRSKEYRQWKESQVVNKEPKRLGDVIESITEATGIKKVVEKIFGEDCGCEERRKKLNTVHLPERFKVRRCLTEEQFNQYKAYRERRTLDYKTSDVQIMIDIFAHVFAIQYHLSELCLNCQGSYKVIKSIEDKLDVVYESYEKEMI